MVTCSCLLGGCKLANYTEHIFDIPGTSTFEMNITSGKFEADLFSMANGTDFAENKNYRMPAVEHLSPDTNGKVALKHVPVKDSIYISGMVQKAANATLASGQYKLASTDDDEDEIVFYMGDATASPAVPADVPDGTQVEILYEYIETVNEAAIDNRSSAIGEAIFVWPVIICGIAM